MLKESTILNTIAGLLPNHQILSDDAYLDETSGFIFTTDMLVESRHFSLDYFSPQDVGWKACAVNLSDIAAQGGLPRFLLISLGLPDTIEMSFIEGFYRGFQELLGKTGGIIAGGDTVGTAQSNLLVVNVTAIGQMIPGMTPGRRQTAQPGDLLITTGPSGLSAVGLQALQQSEPGFEACKLAHRRPIPRLLEGQILSQHYRRYGLMDTSDGLADAVLKMARESQVKIEISASALTIHPEVSLYAQKHDLETTSLMLYGGEDFELIASVPSSNGELPPTVAKHFKIIGRVDSGPAEATLVDTQGKTLETLTLDKTYQHFAQHSGVGSHSGVRSEG